MRLKSSKNSRIAAIPLSGSENIAENWRADDHQPAQVLQMAIFSYHQKSLLRHQTSSFFSVTVYRRPTS